MENSCSVRSKPKSVKEFFTTWYFWKPFIGVIIGLMAGFFYFHIVECTECAWAFTGDTLSSMFFGGLLGFFVTGSPCARLRR
jgi:hypothetical protein